MQTVTENNSARRNLSQVIADYTAQKQNLPPVEPDKPGTPWQRLKTRAVAHINQKHGLTVKRLIVILNRTEKQIGQLTDELLREGAIEELNGAFYPAGTLAKEPALFQPEVSNEMVVSHVEPEPSKPDQKKLVTQAMERRIEETLQRFEEQKIHFSMAQLLKEAQVGKTFLSDRPKLHSKVKEASIASEQFKAAPKDPIAPLEARIKELEAELAVKAAPVVQEVKVQQPIAWLQGERMYWRDRIQQMKGELQQLQDDLMSAEINLACVDRLIEISDQEGA